MPERSHQPDEGGAAPVRSFWSGTITFGLVSIPVDLFSASRPRRKSMKLVDREGHALGRQYHCSKEGKTLSSDDLVRGFETDTGKMIVITDDEFASVAPETSRDIELRRFVPLAQIAPMYFDRPYYLAPAGRSAKAYNLLARTMERTQRVAIGSFVMRGQEYLVAIISENGVLRAETLRHADELRKSADVGLPKTAKVSAARVNALVREIEDLTEKGLNLHELEDREAEALQELAQDKQKQGRDVITQSGLEDEEGEEGGAEIIDLMQILRKSLSKTAIVKTGAGATVTSLTDRRRSGSPTSRRKAAPARKTPAKKKTTARSPRKKRARASGR